MSLASRIAELIVPQQNRSAGEFVLADVFQGDDRNYLHWINALQNRRTRATYRVPSVHESLGAPAIFSAVSLISNTVGSLSLEAFRQGVRLADTDRPRLIVRPNPFTTPRDFFRDTAFYLATRGEAWWWIAARDPFDNAPLSLYPIPPWELTVAQNDRNRLRPKITWMNRVMDNDDLRHITYLPSSDGLRGVGPLQVCGAAMSVTVEAQEWAANFYSGSLPSIVGTTDQDMSDEEIEALDRQWQEKPGGLPRWLTNGLKLEESPFDAEKAQLTESRQHQVGEAARMFSMPGALVEYQMGGSSLTYQNQADIWNDFQRRCLSPHYLEPIEQEISDLLTRATVARFNLDQLLRADAKTRAEVYEKLVPIGVVSAEEARQREGFDPGAVDFSPVPLATPQATPSFLPVNRSAMPIHCQKCNRMLAEAATPPYRFTCPRCKTVNEDFRTVEQAAEAPPQQPIFVEVHPPNVTVEAPQVHFDQGAIRVEAPDLRPVAEMADRQPPPMEIEMKHPDIGALADAVDNLRDRPIQNTIDSHEFAAAIIDLKTELARRKEIVRDENGRIVGVK